MDNSLDVNIKINRDIAKKEDILLIFSIFMDKALKALKKEERE